MSNFVYFLHNIDIYKFEIFLYCLKIKQYQHKFQSLVGISWRHAAI